MSSVWEGRSMAGPAPDNGRHGGGGVELGVWADLAVKIGGLCDRMDRQQAYWDRVAASWPGDYQTAAVGVYPSSGTLALDLGGPALGTEWDVRRIVVGGQVITDAPAGVGWVFVQGSPPNAGGATPSVAQAADVTANSLPQRAFYGTHELVAGAGEHVWVVIVGGTAGAAYSASVKAEVFDTDHRLRSIF